MDSRGRSPRSRNARRCTSARSRLSTSANSASLTCTRRTTRSFTTSVPPSPTAPIANSGWNGTPSLRTTITSSGASSARATSAATGTPPRGNPSTTTSSTPQVAQPLGQPPPGVLPILERHDNPLDVEIAIVRRPAVSAPGRRDVEWT